MTNEKALTIVNDVIEKAKITPMVENYSLWETIRDALEKQIAKKVVRRTESEGNFTVHCPSCTVLLMRRITTDSESYPIIYNTTSWCIVCGQKLGWEDYE